MKKIESTYVFPLENSLSTQNIDKLEVKFRIGGGNFGDVYLAKWKNVDVAAKLMKNNDKPDEVIKEVEILKSLNHPFILKMFGTYDDPNQGIFIVMEYIEQGSLDKFILNNKEKIGYQQLVEFGYQICQGMVYLSENQIIHRDLALR